MQAAKHLPFVVACVSLVNGSMTSLLLRVLHDFGSNGIDSLQGLEQESDLVSWQETLTNRTFTIDMHGLLKLLIYM